MSITTIPESLYPVLRSINPVYSTVLSAAEDCALLVFEAPKTGTINKIGWKTGAITQGTSYSLLISMETVAAVVGQPVATTNAGKTLYAAGAVSAALTSLTAQTVYFTAINGATGISVTQGDLICITWRLTAVSGATINIQNSNAASEVVLSIGNGPYAGSHTGTTWSVGSSASLSLEYSDGFVPMPFIAPITTVNTLAWSNAGNPDRRGIRFSYPFSCRLNGAVIRLALAGNVNIILYDSDGYTVMSGFPISLNALQTTSASVKDYYIVFPTKPTLAAGAVYRLAVLPITSTSISLYNYTPVDDGSFLGITAFSEGTNVEYTAFNGTPTSGNHAWTDSSDKPDMQLVIDGIDVGGGGLLTHPGMNGGFNA